MTPPPIQGVDATKRGAEEEIPFDPSLVMPPTFPVRAPTKPKSAALPPGGPSVLP